jgi:hypothetical protein
MVSPTPETAITANQILSLIGAITGPIGVVISLLVYFRDRAKVRVVLAFDMQGFGALTQVPDKYFAVRIFNIGRRPIYLDRAHIVFPQWARRQIGVTHFLLSSGVQGVKIGEGDPPHTIPTRQRELAKHSRLWPYMRAGVVDATGREYYSAWPTTKPEWGGEHEHRFRVFTNKIRNRLRRLRP